MEEVEGFAMRFIPIVLALLSACTSKNPNLCCVDEADCAAVGLDEIKNCDDGLLCRGNQCIAEVCSASAECEAAAPYCVGPPDGRCQEQCSDDSQCPGFGQAATDAFCVAGDCVQCRETADCAGTTPVCNAGACVACASNDQCDSGVCVEDGTCADETVVAYVALTGSSTGQCTKAAPCSTIEFALTLMRPFVVIESGTYTRNSSLVLDGVRRLIGTGLTPPIIKRSTQGSIVTIIGDIGLERLQLEGATGPTGRDATAGNAVTCNNQGAPRVRIVDSVLRSNVSNGLAMQNCTAELLRSTFTGNTSGGVESVDSSAIVDGCTFSNNGKGFRGDNGTYSFTNNFFSRNTGTGLEVFFFAAGNVIEFNTIVDNGGDGLNCTVQSASGSFSNNIIARNMRQTNGTSNGCTYPSSIIIDADITPLKFVSPDAAPFDYHIQTGSLAIDMATITTVDHDFDGDPRPSNAADVGADEL